MFNNQVPLPFAKERLMLLEALHSFSFIKGVDNLHLLSPSGVFKKLIEMRNIQKTTNYGQIDLDRFFTFHDILSQVLLFLKMIYG